jgi:hypothetical protein
MEAEFETKATVYYKQREAEGVAPKGIDFSNRTRPSQPKGSSAKKIPNIDNPSNLRSINWDSTLQMSFDLINQIRADIDKTIEKNKDKSAEEKCELIDKICFTRVHEFLSQTYHFKSEELDAGDPRISASAETLAQQPEFVKGVRLVYPPKTDIPNFIRFGLK